MAAISNNNIADAIYLASKENDNARNEVFYKKVVEFLTRKRLISKAPDILSRLTKIINNREGKIAVKIFSSEKLSEAKKRELHSSLVKRYHGKDILLEEILDERILGGIKIEVEDEVIDLSIKNRINKLQEYLTKSA